MKADQAGIMSQVAEFQKRFQEKLEQVTVEASAGGGMVKATCNGHGEVTGLRIDPEVVNADDVELLEDLVRAAVNDAQTRAHEHAQKELRGLFGNLPIPDFLGGMPL